MTPPKPDWADEQAVRTIVVHPRLNGIFDIWFEVDGSPLLLLKKNLQGGDSFNRLVKKWRDALAITFRLAAIRSGEGE